MKLSLNSFWNWLSKILNNNYENRVSKNNAISQLISLSAWSQSIMQSVWLVARLARLRIRRVVICISAPGRQLAILSSPPAPAPRNEFATDCSRAQWNCELCPWAVWNRKCKFHPKAQTLTRFSKAKFNQTRVIPFRLSPSQLFWRDGGCTPWQASFWADYFIYFN